MVYSTTTPATRAERERARSRAVISGLRGGGSGPRTAPITLRAPGHFGQQPGAHPIDLGLFRAAAFVCRGTLHIVLMQ